jgi:hypothetical protein
MADCIVDVAKLVVTCDTEGPTGETSDVVDNRELVKLVELGGCETWLRFVSLKFASLR